MLNPGLGELDHGEGLHPASQVQEQAVGGKCHPKSRLPRAFRPQQGDSRGRGAFDLPEPQVLGDLLGQERDVPAERGGDARAGRAGADLQAAGE